MEAEVAVAVAAPVRFAERPARLEMEFDGVFAEDAFLAAFAFEGLRPLAAGVGGIGGNVWEVGRGTEMSKARAAATLTLERGGDQCAEDRKGGGHDAESQLHKNPVDERGGLVCASLLTSRACPSCPSSLV